MERKRVDFEALDPGIHLAALHFEESAVDSFHSPLPADLRPTTFVSLYPPTFATFKGRCWLVANHLSLLLILRVLKTTLFDANICDWNDCRNDRDVEHFARCDRLLYQGILNRPLKAKRTARIYTAQAKRIKAGQVCPICPADQVPKPLTVPKHAPGLIKRGKGGPIICKSCSFRIDLSVEQLQACSHHTLSTFDLAEVQRDPQGNRTVCPLCAKAGRTGILLMRKPTATGGAIHVSCSRSIHFHTSPDCDYPRAVPVQEAT